MLRTILVALDGTEPSRVAQEIAIGFARRFKADITGLAVLDREYITAPTAVGIGGMAFKQHRDQVKLEQAHRFLERLEQHFQASCENLGIKWRVIEEEGAPFDLICGEAHRNDLLVIGRDTDFHLDEESAVADVVFRLLAENPRPVIVCPDHTVPDGPIIAASDGGPQSSRALHMLALLGLARDRVIHVLAMADVHDAARHYAERPAELLARHGLQVEVHAIESTTEPHDVICEQAERLGAAMVAIGASSRGRLRDFFLGSTARRLLNTCPCPLFVHH